MTIDRGKARFAVFLWMLAAFGLVICATSAQAQMSQWMVKDAWARPPLAPLNNTAVYMVIENHTSTTRSVVSVSAANAGGAELHETQMDGKMMKMMPLKALPVPANGSVELKPGGYHIMLTDIKGPVHVGDQMKLVLKLDDGTSIPVTITVKSGDPPGDAPGAGMHMPTPEPH